MIFFSFPSTWSVIPTLTESHLYSDLDFVTQLCFFLICKFPFANFIRFNIFLVTIILGGLLTSNYSLVTVLSSLSFLTVELLESHFLSLISLPFSLYPHSFTKTTLNSQPLKKNKINVNFYFSSHFNLSLIFVIIDPPFLKFFLLYLLLFSFYLSLLKLSSFNHPVTLVFTLSPWHHAIFILNRYFI